MEDTSPGLKSRFTSFMLQCKRVWLVLRKPTNQEFSAVAKVSALGVLLLGALGFIIADVIKLLV